MLLFFLYHMSRIYSRVEKGISCIMLAIMLFGITFRVPLSFLRAEADSEIFYDVVSIIVDEKSYDAL